jgi:phosphate transport system permease protein
MTEIVLPSARRLDLASDAAKVRLRARYRAEARFRLYGLTAVGLAVLFLALVLTDIVRRGYPAFWQHRMLLDFSVTRADVDPQASNDPAVIRGADFQLLVRNALRAQFPDVTDRAGRRLLEGILSSGAADTLRERVVGEPALIGGVVRLPVLFSDDADLYYKGGETRIERRGGLGTLSLAPAGDGMTLASSSDDFAVDVTAITQRLSAQARRLRQEADGLRDAVRRITARKTELERGAAAASASPAAAGELANLTGEIDILSQKVKENDEQAAALQARFDDPAVGGSLDEALPSLLVAVNGGLIKLTRLGNASATGTVLLPLASTADAGPGDWEIVTYVTPQSQRRVNDRAVAWLERLKARGMVRNDFNWAFFTSGDSREPELAGIRGALVGSLLTLLVTLVLCLPVGVAAAIYLEELAPKNRLTEVIEVSINNLAAVPSIVFGLLGLAVFLNFFGLPRSAPLVGGLVLALLVLPTIIIAARAALKAVPPSIKEAALGVGASHQQAIFHHVLPLAMPGVMTGTIIGMAHALGETAPLLMIGMVAFIVEVPTGITDPATVLPVQIYLWSDLPELAFQAKTAAAIMVLLVVLLAMNGAAIYLRRMLERRW